MIKNNPRNIKINNKIIKKEIKFPEAVQERVCEFINAKYFDNFCKVKIEKQAKKKATLSCEVNNFQPLGFYLKESISKKNFLVIVLKVIDVIKFCDTHQLNPNNIELRTNTIFIEPNLGTLKFIYWPIVNNQNYEGPKKFFKDLYSKANLSDNSVDDWQQQYNLFLNNLKPFSLNNFENLILKLQGKKPTTKEIAPVSKLLDTDADMGAASNVPNNTLSSDQLYNPLLARKNKYVAAPRRVNSNKSPVNLNTKACLLAKKNNNKILISRSPFKIGKSKNQVDFSIPDSTISRHHADIIFKNDSFYIVDQKSTNHTYINKKLIQPYLPVKLNSGDKIRFANEEFIFKVN